MLIQELTLGLILGLILLFPLKAFAGAWALGEGLTYLENTAILNKSDFTSSLSDDELDIGITSNLLTKAEKNYFEYGVNSNFTLYGFLELGEITERLQFAYRKLPAYSNNLALPAAVTVDYYYSRGQVAVNYLYFQEKNKVASIGFEFNPSQFMLIKNPHNAFGFDFKADHQLHNLEFHFDLGIGTDEYYSDIRIGNQFYYNLGRISPELTLKFAKKTSIADLELTLYNNFLQPTKNLSPVYRMALAEAAALNAIREPLRKALMGPSYNTNHTLMLKSSFKLDEESNKNRINAGIYWSANSDREVNSYGAIFGIEQRF